MPGDGVRTSPVHGWLGYCWLISFWGVMSFYFQTVVMLGMMFPMFLFILSLYLNITFLYVHHFYLAASYICHAILPVAYHFLYPVIMPD